MRLTFLVAILGVALLYVTLWKMELTSKSASDQLRKLRSRLEQAPPPEPHAVAPETVPAAH
jgi:hypothetical protein